MEWLLVTHLYHTLGSGRPHYEPGWDGRAN